ncbi:MAG: hypothetical protein CFE33_20745 [Pseudorhodobacter sp. PARRP1]|nr:MAG: hypothetical protein CFE33_20745 [Pseudorhodobacter sp. PARRP1]
MTPETAINRATTQTFAGETQPVARILPSRRQRALLSRRIVTVTTLPDGNELFMRETATGWTVIDYGTRRTSGIGADSRAAIAALVDIAPAYGFGPLRDAAAPAAKRPSLTLVSSR